MAVVYIFARQLCSVRRSDPFKRTDCNKIRCQTMSMALSLIETNGLREQEGAYGLRI